MSKLKKTYPYENYISIQNNRPKNLILLVLLCITWYELKIRQHSAQSTTNTKVGKCNFLCLSVYANNYLKLCQVSLTMNVVIYLQICREPSMSESDLHLANLFMGLH